MTEPFENAVRVGAPAGVRQTFVLNNRYGLHARPAALLSRTLRNFNCNVQACCGGELANAKSLMGLLTLAAGYGSQITFIADGPESVRAIDAIAKIFETNFRDAY